MGGRPARRAGCDGRGALVVDGLAADAGYADVLVDWDGARVTGAQIEPVESLDPTRRLFRVTGGDRESLGGDVERARLQAMVMNAAESVGVAQRAMEMAVAYAKERKQFGRAIGTYQAVSHACAQMLLEVEGARSAVYWAAWALDHEPETAPLATRLREGLRGRRRPARSALGAPGPRRHRLHLGARPALLPQARRGQRPPVRIGRVAPRDDRRPEPVAPGARIT